jgi:hypothetical protein
MDARTKVIAEKPQSADLLFLYSWPKFQMDAIAYSLALARMEKSQPNYNEFSLT